MERHCLLLILSGMLCLMTGCVHRKHDSLTYLHPDFNTLNRPSIHIDKYSHQPPKARHVDYYRWMHNKGPIDHTLVPELYEHRPVTNQTLVLGEKIGMVPKQADSVSNSTPAPQQAISSNWMFSETITR